MRKLEAVLLAACAGAVLMVFARSQDFARLTAEADTYERAADQLRLVRDSLAYKVALQERAYADSSRVWASRTTEARARAEEAQRRASEATRRANTTATTLVARLDSTEVALFAQYDADRDSIEAAQDDVVDALRTELATVTADRNALLQTVTDLRAEIAAETHLSAQLTLANESLRKALKDAGRESLISRTMVAGAVLYIAADALGS